MHRHIIGERDFDARRVVFLVEEFGIVVREIAVLYQQVVRVTTAHAFASVIAHGGIAYDAARNIKIDIICPVARTSDTVAFHQAVFNGDIWTDDIERRIGVMTEGDTTKIRAGSFDDKSVILGRGFDCGTVRIAAHVQFLRRIIDEKFARAQRTQITDLYLWGAVEKHLVTVIRHRVRRVNIGIALKGRRRVGVYPVIKTPTVAICNPSGHHRTTEQCDRSAVVILNDKIRDQCIHGEITDAVRPREQIDRRT